MPDRIITDRFASHRNEPCHKQRPASHLIDEHESRRHPDLEQPSHALFGEFPRFACAVLDCILRTQEQHHRDDELDESTTDCADPRADQTEFRRTEIPEDQDPVEEDVGYIAADRADEDDLRTMHAVEIMVQPPAEDRPDRAEHDDLRVLGFKGQQITFVDQTKDRRHKVRAWHNEQDPVDHPDPQPVPRVRRASFRCSRAEVL